MTEKEVVLLGKRAYRIAFPYLGKEDAEEIASDVVVFLVTKNPQKYVMKYLVIDAIRKRFGDNRNISHSKRYQLERASRLANSLEPIADSKPDAAQSMETWEDYERVRSILNPIRRCIVTLLVKYGFTHPEIADCFNKSESWVSLELKNSGHSVERLRVLRRKNP